MCLKHAKLDRSSLLKNQKEETNSRTEQKGRKGNRQTNTQQKSESEESISRKKDFRVTIREVSAKTVIRMLYMEGILKEKP